MHKKKRKDTVVTIEVAEFANRYGYTEKTIKKNFERIAGAYKNGSTFVIPDSARYPYRIGHASLKTREDKRYILLKATSMNMYVDEKILGLSKVSFNTLIDELLSQGLLIENNSNDKYGANSYDTSYISDCMLKSEKRRAMVDIAKAIAEVSGSFASQLCPR